jgi:hypothetical protein
MSRARNLADLLDANGDVASGALDNVPPSNDASALTTGTLPIARIADGDITAAKLGSTLDLSGKTVTLPSGTGGKVLQVLQTGTSPYTTYYLSTSFGVPDIGMELTITPSATSSKILIMVTYTLDMLGDTNHFARLLRNSTEIGMPLGANANNGGSSYFEDGSGNFGSANQHGLNFAFNYLDSPSTTSAVTYTVEMKENSNTLVSHSGSTSFTIMEIAG